MKRVLLYPLAVTEDARRATSSKLVWGERVTPGGQRYYVLTPLGLVNTVRDWLGLRPWGIR